MLTTNTPLIRQSRRIMLGIIFLTCLIVIAACQNRNEAAEPDPQADVTATEEADVTQTNTDEQEFEAADVSEPVYQEIAEVDAALTAVINRNSLTPRPGIDLREEDTALAQLGQALFFDPILSGDRNIACATCHHPALAMGDARALPIGTSGQALGPQRAFAAQVTMDAPPDMSAFDSAVVDPDSGAVTVDNPFIDEFVPRNSPTVLNAALLPVQFWDGRVESYALNQPVITPEDGVNDFGITDALAAQALFPVTSMHEMAGMTLGNLEPHEIRAALISRLNEIPAYREQFTAVFDTEEITEVQVATAIAAFERRFIFTDAPWDAYVAGDSTALTDQEKRGALLFFGKLNLAVNCAQCHSGDLFTDLGYHNILAPQLGPGKGVGEDGREDWGRRLVTLDDGDQFAFRTPGLRNVALTAPYMHSGAYATLEATIAHHADMWESAAGYDPALHLPDMLHNSVMPFESDKLSHSAAPQLQDGLPLSTQDIADLTAFLHALTDPAATDLMHFVPESVPSGLPLDPLPGAEPVDIAVADGGTGGLPDPAGQTEPDVSDPPPATNWHFTDATTDVGLDFEHAGGMPTMKMGGGLCWIDYDNDGWLDLYLVNSTTQKDHAHGEAQGTRPHNVLLRNDNGRFTDVSTTTQTDLTLRGVGCYAVDVNHDGWTDLFITAAGPNVLLRNNGDGTFTQQTAPRRRLPRGSVMNTIRADFDNDTDLDVLVVNGRSPSPHADAATPLQLIGSLAAEGTPDEFASWADHLPADLAEAPFVGSAAVADFDNDGDLDAVINRVGETAVFLRNDGGSEAGSWLQIELDDSAPAAFVTITLPDGRELTHKIDAATPRLHLGLGNANTITTLHVRWPDRTTTTLESVAVNQLLHVSK